MMQLENIPASQYYEILLKMFYWMKLLQFEKIGGNLKHLELENQLDVRSKNLSNWIMIDFPQEIPNITQSWQWKKIKSEASWTCWISPWTGTFPGALERCRMVEMVPCGLQRTVSHSRSHLAQHISRNTLGKQPVIPLPKSRPAPAGSESVLTCLSCGLFNQPKPLVAIPAPCLLVQLTSESKRV